MSEIDLIRLSNGNIPRLGWCRLTRFRGPKNCLKMFSNAAFFGKSDNKEFQEGYLFTKKNTPESIYRFISPSHFCVFRQPTNDVNFKPAKIHVYSPNGIFLNDAFVAQGQTKILRTGDIIGFSPEMGLFQFLDDRVFETNGIPLQIIRKYHIDSLIGKGGQSTVRKLYEFKSGEKFGMKIIQKSQHYEEPSQHYQKRLQHMHDEVKIMRQLRNINIIQLVETFETHNELFIVMEFAVRDLCDHLRQYPGNFLPEHEAKFCFYQITKGLVHIHVRNIAHRDLKIENIFVTHRDVNGYTEIIYKIGDFGFSKNADHHLLTQLGTECYLPPEIQRGCGEYTIKADIWSLGCLFFVCLTAMLPFSVCYGSTIQEQIATATLNWSSPNWRCVSCYITRLIRIMIQVEPERRPRASDLLKAKWFTDDKLKLRTSPIYDLFPVVKNVKKKNLFTLDSSSVAKKKKS